MERKVSDQSLIEYWNSLEYPTISSVASHFRVSERTISRRLRRLGISWKSSSENQVVRKLKDLREKCHKVIAEYYTNLRFINQKIISIRYPCKILYFADPHIPFINIDIIREMINKDGDADYFVTDELLDFQTFMTFIKFNKTNPCEEDKLAEEFIELLSNHFKKGFILSSNHTERFEKFLAKSTDVVQFEYLRYLWGELLPRCLKKMSKNIFYISNNAVQLGRAVCAHFDVFYSFAGITPERIYAFLQNHGDIYGFKNFDSIWIGHTHNLSLHYAFNKMFCEVGCVCYLLDYLFRKVKLASQKFRWINGYGVIILDKDGNTDFSNSKVQFIAFAQNLKKDLQ